MAAAAGAAGCGFRPLYGPVGEQGPVGPELAAIRVDNIPDRFGQLLRRDLERRLEGSSPGTAARYLLSTSVSFGIEPVGYRGDGAVTRVRAIASGRWSLFTLAVPPAPVGSSSIPVRTIDSFNIPDLQFFAADSARDAMERRIAEAMAAEVVEAVARLLRERLAATG